MKNFVWVSFACFIASIYAGQSAFARSAEPDKTPSARQKKIADACQAFLEEGIALPGECARYLGTQRALVAEPAAVTAPAPKPRIPIPKPLPIEGSTTGAPFPLLRQDQYDQVSFAVPELPYQVLQGAAITYSKDQIAKNQSLNVKGFLGYSAYNWSANRTSIGCGTVDDGGGAFLSRYGAGPFVQANGTFNQPTTASEKSALRVGFNSDARFCDTALFQQQEFQLMPYGQTDFRGKANIAGFDALWEPYYYDDNVHLGERLDVGKPKFIGYYFRVLGEANVFEVHDAGLTNFTPHTNYALLGGTAEARAVLFENDPSVGPALCGAISLIGTARYLWDAVSRKPIYLYGAEVDYKLGGKSASNASCPTLISSPASTSVALSYNQGTDPMTFVKQNVYKATLKFAY